MDDPEIEMFPQLVSLFLILIVAVPHPARGDRRTQTEDAAGKTDNGSQQQRNQAQAARMRAAALEDQAKGQDAICAA